MLLSIPLYPAAQPNTRGVESLLSLWHCCSHGSCFGFFFFLIDEKSSWGMLCCSASTSRNRQQGSDNKLDRKAFTATASLERVSHNFCLFYEPFSVHIYCSSRCWGLEIKNNIFFWSISNDPNLNVDMFAVNWIWHQALTTKTRNCKMKIKYAAKNEAVTFL